MKKALSILFAVVLVFAALPVSAATVDESNLQVRYEFDGDLGNSTQAGLNLAGDGTVTFVDGVVGEAAYFDGSSTLILDDASLSGDEYAVSLWLKPDELTQHTAALFAYVDADNFISVAPHGPGEGDPQTILWSGSTTWFDGLTGTVTSAGEWTHFAFSASGDQVTIYINGAEVGQQDGWPNLVADGASIALGGNMFELDAEYKGAIDDVIVFDSAVSGDVIADYYASATGDAPAEPAEEEATEEAPADDEAAEEKEEATTLPATATNQFTFIMIGALLVLISGGFLLAKNRVSNKE